MPYMENPKSVMSIKILRNDKEEDFKFDNE